MHSFSSRFDFEFPQDLIIVTSMSDNADDGFVMWYPVELKRFSICSAVTFIAFFVYLSL
jgi:hypothetical protein